MALEIAAARADHGDNVAADPHVRFCGCFNVRKSSLGKARVCAGCAVLAAVVVLAGIGIAVWRLSGSCGSTIPTQAGPLTVKLAFYSNGGGGSEGDTCPSACAAGSEIKTQYYAVHNATAGGDPGCREWPGNSGKNSMKEGTCDLVAQTFSYDQWTNCDCSGSVGSHKTVHMTKCVVDMPPTLCVKLVDMMC